MNGNFSNLSSHKRLPKYKQDEETEWILAYRELIESFYDSYGSLNDLGFDLVYFDGDDIPELVVMNHWGIEVSMYTIKDGKIVALLEEAGYGAAGKRGYEYLPYQGILYNIDADCGGGIYNIAYWKMNEQSELEFWYTLTAGERQWLEYTFGMDFGTNIKSEDWLFYYGGKRVSHEKFMTYVLKGEYLDKDKRLCEYFFDLKEVYAYYMQHWEDAPELLFYHEVLKELKKTEQEEYKDLRYELLYFDADGFPELFVIKPECWIRLYHVKDGLVSILLEENIDNETGKNVKYQFHSGAEGILKKTNDNGNTAYCKMGEQGELERWYMVEEKLSEDGKIYLEHDGQEVPRDLLITYYMKGDFRPVDIKKLPEYKQDPDAKWILAYREIIEEYYSSVDRQTFDWADYTLIYLDEDDIPEMVIDAYKTWHIYTMKNGVVYTALVSEEFAELNSKEIDYFPKKGILRTTVKTYGSIKDDRPTEKVYYWRMNEQNELEETGYYTYKIGEFEGERSYFYNDEEISKEEFDSFYDVYIGEDESAYIDGQNLLYDYFLNYD